MKKAQRWLIWSTTAVMAVVLIPVLYNATMYQYSLTDAVRRTYAVVRGTHGTRWTEGFSDRAFSNIRIGMSENDVVTIVGQPLWRSDRWGHLSKNVERLDFALPLDSALVESYDVRRVVLDADGHVETVMRMYEHKWFKW